MKAFLLAAGLGTRLRPITDSVSKCLVPINGRPLLSYWLELLERHGIDEVLINLHHLPGGVRQFADDYRGAVKITLVMEPELLGSAGTLQANQAWVEGEEQFYILYADNLTNANLSALREFNTRHPAPLTVGLFHAENPSACGIAELDEAGVIVGFVEKPEEPPSDLASAGMFIARASLFDYVCSHSYPYDIGNHLLPTLVGSMNGVLVDGYIRDIGTHESLKRAEAEWPQLPGSVVGS